MAVWAAVAVYRRGLYVSMPLVAPMRRDVQVSTTAGRRVLADGDPHLMIIRLTARGINDIEPDNFKGDLVIDVGVHIVELLRCRTEPGHAMKPQAWCAGSQLYVPPTLMKRGTRLFFDLLTADGRPARLALVQEPVANVHVREFVGDDRPPAPWPISFGVAAALADLILPHLLPRLAATEAYKTTNVVLGVMVTGILGIATIRLVRRMYRRGM